MSEAESGGCCGVIAATAVAIIILWALAFGVSYGGRHYSLSCTCDGVRVENRSAEEAE